LEVPTLLSKQIVEKCLENTNNKAFEIEDKVLMPEVTQYVRNLGVNGVGTNKVYYVARCFRNEASTNANRLREFTQIGVEYLGDNELDCCRDVRKDAIWLFKMLKGNRGWKLMDDAQRGLNIYVGDKAFEIFSDSGIQLLGGGPYQGGAGWAIGFERLLNDGSVKIG
jgi:histidyl-tRNA synthetase